MTKMDTQRAEMYWGNSNVSLNLLLLLDIEKAQVIEILPRGKQESVYTTESVLSLLMTSPHKQVLV